MRHVSRLKLRKPARLSSNVSFSFAYKVFSKYLIDLTHHSKAGEQSRGPAGRFKFSSTQVKFSPWQSLKRVLVRTHCSCSGVSSGVLKRWALVRDRPCVFLITLRSLRTLRQSDVTYSDCKMTNPSYSVLQSDPSETTSRATHNPPRTVTAQMTRCGICSPKRFFFFCSRGLGLNLSCPGIVFMLPQLIYIVHPVRIYICKLNARPKRVYLLSETHQKSKFILKHLNFLAVTVLFCFF